MSGGGSSDADEEDEDGAAALSPLACDDDGAPVRRAVCARCQRPAAADCLCAALPAAPLDLLGAVIVLQHPHERARALATVPLLTASLRNCWVVRARAYRPGRAPALDAALAAARRPDKPLPLFLLWPGADATDAADTAAALAGARAAAGRARESEPSQAATDDDVAAALRRCAYALVVPDGTWPQCGEMVRALAPLLCPPAALLRLPGVAGAAPDAATMLRTEPAPGCMVTAEAVARALGALEGGGGGGAAERALLAPVRLLAALQRRRDARGKGVRDTQRRSRLHLAA